MFVNADQYSVIKNKWKNQQIHKIHNEIQYASKHYFNVNYDNDIIFTPKPPTNKRKHRKKYDNMIERQRINKTLTFDYYDFMFQNKNENYKRIHIRPTIYYNQTRDYIDDIIHQFYDQSEYDIFSFTNKTITKPKTKQELNTIMSAEREKANDRRLYIKSLAWKTNDNSLAKVFKKYGELEEAVVIKDKRTHKSKGFGFVTFKSYASAQAAVSQDDIRVDGRKIQCNYADGIERVNINITKNDSVDVLDPKTCYKCGTKYKNLNNKHCLYCANSQWLQSLFEGNKVDIFDNKYENWYIGTVIKINRRINDKQLQLDFLIHYDGFKSFYDEWITFNFGFSSVFKNVAIMCKNKIIKLKDKLQKLHTITSYHAYELMNKYNKLQPCISRPYKKCILCDTKYCIQCMNEEIKDKECNQCLRLIRNNKWLKQLEKNDKLDVYLFGYKGKVYNCKWHCAWQIGTVLEIKKDDFDLKRKLKLFVHFDGLEDSYNKWIEIKCWTRLIGHKVNKLNKFTLFHSYLKDEKQNICAEINKWKKCVDCKRKCCLKCLKPGVSIDSIGYKCNECGIKNEQKDLLNAIKQSLYGKYYTFGSKIEMNIIYIIYEYSQGITVNCCNQIKNCVNEINFNTIYEMELNVQQNSNFLPEIYQYYLYKNQTSNIYPNVTIYNKKRRIFCIYCTKNELIKCAMCNKSQEVQSINRKWVGFTCRNCLDSIEKKEKEKEIEIELKASIKKTKKREEDNSFVDMHFKNFKDNIFPKIKLKKSKTKENAKIINKILEENGVSIDDLPYTIWSKKCNLHPNCWRKYCAFYHSEKEKEIGKIVSMMIQKQKHEKRIYTDKSTSYHKGFNAELMDYKFNLDYSYDKMRKRRKSKFSRKYHVQRSTKKRKKRRAYYSRKADKKSNVKENKKFKVKYLCEKELYKIL